MQIILAVVGDLRNTMEPRHNTGQIPFQIWTQYKQKWAFCIVFSNQYHYVCELPTAPTGPTILAGAMNRYDQMKYI